MRGQQPATKLDMDGKTMSTESAPVTQTPVDHRLVTSTAANCVAVGSVTNKLIQPATTPANAMTTAPYVDMVGTALQLKLAHELGRHRLARQALADLTAQLAGLQPEINRRAAAADDEPDDTGLGDLLAERWPSQPDPLLGLLPTDEGEVLDVDD